jgi:hypothetical protein
VAAVSERAVGLGALAVHATALRRRRRYGLRATAPIARRAPRPSCRPGSGLRAVPAPAFVPSRLRPSCRPGSGLPAVPAPAFVPSRLRPSCRPGSGLSGSRRYVVQAARARARAGASAAKRQSHGGHRARTPAGDPDRRRGVYRACQTNVRVRAVSTVSVPVSSGRTRRAKCSVSSPESAPITGGPQTNPE